MAATSSPRAAPPCTAPALDVYSGALLEVTTSCVAEFHVPPTGGSTFVPRAARARGRGAGDVLSAGDTVLVLESAVLAAVRGEMARVLGLSLGLAGGWRHAAILPGSRRPG